MTYLLVDDKFPKHVKIRGLPIQAKWLHLCALSHCAEELTDGQLTSYDLGIIAATAEVKPSKFVPLLVQRGLWTTTPDGWEIHDYLDHNPSRTEVQTKRKARAEAGRKGGLASKPASKREANGEAVAQAIASSLASPLLGPQGLEPHPIPSHKSESSSPTVTRDAARETGRGSSITGQEPHELTRLHATTGGTVAALEKLERAARGCSEADLVAAREAATGPGVHDRLAVALATLKKRKQARTDEPPLTPRQHAVTGEPPLG